MSSGDIAVTSFSFLALPSPPPPPPLQCHQDTPHPQYPTLTHAASPVAEGEGHYKQKTRTASHARSYSSSQRMLEHLGGQQQRRGLPLPDPEGQEEETASWESGGLGHLTEQNLGESSREEPRLEPEPKARGRANRPPRPLSPGHVFV